jgi:hypothetical protein
MVIATRIQVNARRKLWLTRISSINHRRIMLLIAVLGFVVILEAISNEFLMKLF